MTAHFKSLANIHIRNLTPYQPGKPIEELEREMGITSPIKLASNENPLGPSPKAIAAVKTCLEKAHLYPDGSCFEIKHAISQYLSVSPDQITMGNGSENILELIIKAYLYKNDSAIISEFAFLTIPLLLQSHAVNTKVVPARAWGHDIDGLIKTVDDKTRVLFLVNPNNPTGTYTNEQDFRHLMESVPPHVLIVVDEAYSEYITKQDYPNTLHYLSHYPNLITVRTFSKAYGLAGFRLGYAVSSPDIADMLNRARLPFNVNTLAAKAGCAALSDQDHLNKSIALNNQGLLQLENGIKQLNLTYIPVVANFITVDVGDGTLVYQKLLAVGVIVRPLKAYNMPKHIRVSVGTYDENVRFLAALQQTLA